jgi:hypothetical protein
LYPLFADENVHQALTEDLALCCTQVNPKKGKPDTLPISHRIDALLLRILLSKRTEDVLISLSGIRELMQSSPDET